MTPGPGGMPAAVTRAEELAKTLPDAVIPGQFDNPANPLVHEKTTAEEIYNDTRRQARRPRHRRRHRRHVDGRRPRLEEAHSRLEDFAVEPTTSAILSGQPRGPHKIQGIGAGFVPGNLDRSLIDEVVTVSSDTAFEVSRTVAKLEGIPGGISTGANVAAAITVAQRPEFAGKTIVTFAPSSAERYFSSELFVEPQPKTLRFARPA